MKAMQSLSTVTRYQILQQDEMYVVLQQNYTLCQNTLCRLFSCPDVSATMHGELITITISYKKMFIEMVNYNAYGHAYGVHVSCM